MKRNHCNFVQTNTNSNRGVAVCPGCKGEQLQIRIDGIKIVCPVCNGSGEWEYVPFTWVYSHVPYDNSGGFIC